MSELNLAINGVNMLQLQQDIWDLKEMMSKFTKPEKKEEIIPFAQGCKELGITRVTGWTWGKQGKIKTYKIGNKVFMKRSEILEVISNNVTKK